MTHLQAYQKSLGKSKLSHLIIFKPKQDQLRSIQRSKLTTGPVRQLQRSPAPIPARASSALVLAQTKHLMHSPDSAHPYQPSLKTCQAKPSRELHSMVNAAFKLTFNKCSPPRGSRLLYKSLLVQEYRTVAAVALAITQVIQGLKTIESAHTNPS